MSKKLFLPLALVIALTVCSTACNAHEHVWDEGVVTKQPTCYEQGVKEFTCECGEKRQEPIEMTAHNLGDGYESDDDGHWQKCQNAGCDYTTAKTGHNWNDGVETTPATCHSKGVKRLTCTVCNRTSEEETDMTSHNLGDGYESDDDGHWQACQNDGCDYTTAKTGHNWNAGVETTPATCYGDGVKTFECTVCGKTKTEKITATGAHVFSQLWSYDEDVHYHACTTVGCTARSDEHEHNWNAGVETLAATCYSDGVKTFECTDCGATRTEKITATGQHTFSQQWSFDDKNHYHACTTDGCTARSDEHEHNWDGGRETQTASCDQNGEITYECTDCDATKTESTPKKAHVGEWTIDGTTWGGTLSRECSVCGQPEDAIYAMNGAEYEVTVGGGQSAAFVYNSRINSIFTFETIGLTGEINIEYVNYTGSEDVTDNAVLNAEESKFQLNLINRHVIYFILTSESEEPLTFKVKMYVPKTMGPTG